MSATSTDQTWQQKCEIYHKKVVKVQNNREIVQTVQWQSVWADIESCLLSFTLRDIRCSWIVSRAGEVRRFSDADRDQLVSNVIESMASDGLRTICLAYKNFVTSMHTYYVWFSVLVDGCAIYVYAIKHWNKCSMENLWEKNLSQSRGDWSQVNVLFRIQSTQYKLLILTWNAPKSFGCCAS